MRGVVSVVDGPFTRTYRDNPLKVFSDLTFGHPLANGGMFRMTVRADPCVRPAPMPSVFGYLTRQLSEREPCLKLQLPFDIRASPE